MKDDSAYQTKLETAAKPTPNEAKALRETHFNYRRAIGEAIYAMVTCRPDISYTVIKLTKILHQPSGRALSSSTTPVPIPSTHKRPRHTLLAEATNAITTTYRT